MATATTTDRVINVVVAGLGGQGVVKASDILADAVFRAGFDVKKAEVHGMSQRGGSVSTDVRFGAQVLSPMVPEAEADYLVMAAADQLDANKHRLKPDGILIMPGQVDATKLANAKSLNVALLGILSKHLPMTEEHWLAAIAANLDPKLLDANRQAFALGRSLVA